MSIFLKNLSNSTYRDSLCDVCFRAKQTRNSFPLSHNKAQNLFEIVHCDIWGPYRVSTSCGARYFLTLVNDYSRSVWAYLMVEKSETSKLLQDFTALVRNQFNKVVKILRTDNVFKFKSNEMLDFYRKYGILHQTNCVNTPQQNG